MSHFGPRRRQHLSRQSSLGVLEALELRLLLSVNSVNTHPLVSGPREAMVPIVLGSSTPSSSQNVLPSIEIRERSATVSVVPSTGNLSVYRYEWKVVETPTGGAVSFAKNATNTAKVNTLSFSCAGTYLVRVTVQNTGTVLSSNTLQFNVVQTFAKIGVKTGGGQTVTGSGLIVRSTSQQLSAIALDQFGAPLVEQVSCSWTVAKNPVGGQATLNSSGNTADFTFNKAGTYAVNATSGRLVFNLKMTVEQDAKRLTLTPGSLVITFGTPRQILAQTVDQFGLPLFTQPTVTWNATGGTISTKGIFTTGNQAGSFSIGARTATLTETMSVEVTAPVAPPGLTDPALADLVNTFYADQKIDRAEMMQILRSGGNDGTVNATELTDLRFLVSATTPFSIPGYVRELASDVVGTNLANRMFQGKTAGNLSAGSSATLLNNLVDKWFLGADEPQIGNASLTYQTTIGNLFNGSPSRRDARQGRLGDCYFIAAVAAIADNSPNSVRDIFTDNGDGTYTVRFCYGVGAGTSKVDYVTVNRRLPAYANGTLGLSGYGQSISSTATTLWIALAEKAYAQWNETGNEGRDGTNRYSAIEGGWMSNVNAQILGHNSTDRSFLNSSKLTLVNALTAHEAVTVGTRANASTGGLYGQHAYLVTEYNSSTDTFTLHNPWGVLHPTPLTWTQLQANCSSFVTTNATGLTTASLPHAASLPRTSKIAPVADRTQAIPTMRTNQIQSGRLTHRAVDDVSDSELNASSQTHAAAAAAAALNARMQELPKTNSGFDFMNLEPDPGPEQTSELLPAELLDLTFLDLFVLAKSGSTTHEAMSKMHGC